MLLLCFEPVVLIVHCKYNGQVERRQIRQLSLRKRQLNRQMDADWHLFELREDLFLEFLDVVARLQC